MLRIQTPHCPVCGGPPVLGLTLILPWFCEREDCLVLAWDPYASLEENLMDSYPFEVIETPWPNEDQPTDPG